MTRKDFPSLSYGGNSVWCNTIGLFLFIVFLALGFESMKRFLKFILKRVLNMFSSKSDDFWSNLWVFELFGVHWMKGGSLLSLFCYLVAVFWAPLIDQTLSTWCSWLLYPKLNVSRCSHCLCLYLIPVPGRNEVVLTTATLQYFLRWESIVPPFLLFSLRIPFLSSHSVSMRKKQGKLTIWNTGATVQA